MVQRCRGLVLLTKKTADLQPPIEIMHGESSCGPVMLIHKETCSIPMFLQYQQG